MESKPLKRKLTAIFSADVEGYSRMMSEDEDTTVRTLKAYRELLAAILQKHQGRVVDNPGDNLLAEFSSVVEAVRCAVAVQKELKGRNAELPESRRMEFRIGVNLGDVIEDEKRLYGDGVNIAARIEGLAGRGGICISGSAYEQIKNKLNLGYEYLGKRNVKNISDPVKVFRVLMEPEAIGQVFGEKNARWLRNRWAAFAAIIFVILTAAATIWNFYGRSPPYSKETTSTAKTPEIPIEKSSIAVLPFQNLSGDQEQEYFSDGITNDIITDLSKFRLLLVIASNSVFIYKGKPVKVQEVSRELGVRYVLEGSVQRAGDKVRINAQLIDATNGHHLWAERYERELKDLFAVQDEIVQTIVATLAVKLDAEERARAMRKDTDNLEAYDYVLRGLEYLSRVTPSDNKQAQQMFEKAIELDTRYAAAYVGLGQTHLSFFRYGWTEFASQELQQAHDLAQYALELDEANASAHALLGTVYRYRLQYELAIKEFERAIELNPNDAASLADIGTVFDYLGRQDEAIHALETALRFNPKMFPRHYMHLGLAYYLKGRYDDSIRILERSVGRYPKHVFLYIALAAAYAQANRPRDAERTASTVRRLHPFFEVDSYGTAYVNQADRASIVDGLRKAGLN